MAKYSKLDTLIKIRENKVIPLFYNDNPEIGIEIAKALYKGGLRIMEFTNRGDFAHHVFSRINQYIQKNLPDMVLGVGTVVDTATAALYIQEGAHFVVSPLLNMDMAKVCNRRKIPWVPGCATISEISQAEEAGADLVKLYPAKLVGGPAYLKAIKGPCPRTEIMASGGVSPEKENLKAWFTAGAFCVGIGSKLISKEIVENKDFERLEQNTVAIKKILNQL